MIRMFFLLTLAPRNHKMNMTITVATGKRLRCSDDFAQHPLRVSRLELSDYTFPGAVPGKSQLHLGAEGANLARRNQMKLSGKRTLSPTKLWKVRSWHPNRRKRYRRCKFC